MVAIIEDRIPSASDVNLPTNVKAAKKCRKFLNKQTSRDVWKATPQLHARVLCELKSLPRGIRSAKARIFPYRDIHYESSMYCEDDEDTSTFAILGPLRVCIEDGPTAVSVALNEYQTNHVENEMVPNRFVLWVDASMRKVKQGGVGISVVHKDLHGSDDWITRGYVVDQRMTTLSAEALAIAQALHNASYLSNDLLGPKATIVVYSDCKYTLRHTIDTEESIAEDLQFIINATKCKAESLRRRGFEVELRWVPSHQHVPGNLLADNVARLASKNQSMRTLDSRRRP